MSDLSGKTIIVTGGGSGIGRATVELLVASGANVAVADINDEAGEAVVAASGGKAAYFRCDIAQEEDVKALVAQTLAAFGGLDGAFNNAAIPQDGLPLRTEARTVGKEGVSKCRYRASQSNTNKN